jgi:hypothetical protein
MHPLYNQQKVHNVQATARQRAKKKKCGVLTLLAGVVIHSRIDHKRMVN